MRIGEVARQAGVSTRALRYYEEQGLLAPSRTHSGQRTYPASAVERVRLIQKLFTAGLPSRTIEQLLPSIDAGQASPVVFDLMTADRLGPAPLIGSGLATLALVTLHYRRFAVPITVAAGAASLCALLFGVLLAVAPDLTLAARNGLFIAAGLGVFALAMRFDLSDPARVTRQMYADYLEAAGRGWVAEVDGEVAAFCYAAKEDGSIWALFVAPRHEGRGLAKRLLGLAVDYLFDLGYDTVTLSTGSDTRADRFYAAQGWTRGAHREHLVGLGSLGEDLLGPEVLDRLSSCGLV